MARCGLLCYSHYIVATETNLWCNTAVGHCKQSSPVCSSIYPQIDVGRDVLLPEKSTLSQLATTDYFQQSSPNKRYYWSVRGQSKWNTTCTYSCHTTIIHFTVKYREVYTRFLYDPLNSSCFYTSDLQATLAKPQNHYKKSTFIKSHISGLFILTALPGILPHLTFYYGFLI